MPTSDEQLKRAARVGPCGRSWNFDGDAFERGTAAVSHHANEFTFTRGDLREELTRGHERQRHRERRQGNSYRSHSET